MAKVLYLEVELELAHGMLPRHEPGGLAALIFHLLPHLLQLMSLQCENFGFCFCSRVFHVLRLSAACGPRVQ